MRKTLIGALAALGMLWGVGCGNASDQSKAQSARPGNPQAASQNAAPGFGGTGGAGSAGQGTSAATAQSKGKQKSASSKSWYGSQSTTYQAPRPEVVQSPIASPKGRLAPTGQASNVGGGGVSGQLGDQGYQGGTLGGPGVSPNEPSSAIRGNYEDQRSTVSTGQGAQSPASNAGPGSGGQGGAR